MQNEFPFSNDGQATPEKYIVELFFYFSVLIEYQLNDLQADVRKFVEAMSNAIQEMDSLVEKEAKLAQSLFETLFNQNKYEQGSDINNDADNRVERIFGEALANLRPGESALQILNSDPKVSDVNPELGFSNVDESKIVEKKKSTEMTEGSEKIWSDVAKRFESFCRLEERLRPQVYTMVQSLNFEDIQTQRIEHALAAQKRLNEGVVSFLKKGIHNCTVNEVKEFANELFQKTQNSYTMSEERDIFDQVFINTGKK
jgi:hypothetical protein